MPPQRILHYGDALLAVFPGEQEDAQHDSRKSSSEARVGEPCCTAASAKVSLETLPAAFRRTQLRILECGTEFIGPSAVIFPVH